MKKKICLCALFNLSLALLGACQEPVSAPNTVDAPAAKAEVLLPVPSAKPPSTPIDLKLSGQVTDQDGTPLSDVLLTLQSPGLAPQSPDDLPGQDRWYRSDTKGKFEIQLTLDRQSTLDLSASKPGFAWRSQTLLAQTKNQIQFVLEPAPFPQGQLALQLTRQDGRQMIVKQNMRGGVLDLVADDAKDPAWSPVAQKLAVIGKDGLYIADLGAEQATRIVTSPNLSQPKWSPDGKSLLFRKAVSDFNGEIFKVSVLDGKPVKLTDHPADEGDPNWSSDGKKIYFTSNRDAPVVAVQSGENPTSTNGYYLRNEVYRASASDGSAPERMTRNGVIDRYPAESPDGKQIAFLNAGSILALMQSDGNAYRQVADRNSAQSTTEIALPGTLASALHWSKDSQWIMAVRQVKLNPPQQDVFVFSSTGPAVYRLTWGGGVIDADWYEEK
jgi:dipeptidyl aminopeptidase/acylaminoacyl peptidase